MPHQLGLAALLALATAQAASGPAFLRPHDQATVAPGPLSIIARASASAQFRLDGAPLAAKPAGPGAWNATAQLAAGPHKIELIDGASTIALTVTAAMPAAFRAHPPAATCDTCHVVRGGTWAFKSDPLSDTCFGCHDAKAFPVPHQHNAEVLNECTLCHDPHGSSSVKHLKMKKELACKQCHG